MFFGKKYKQDLYIYQHMWIYTYTCTCVLSHFSHVQLCATLWTAACQATLSMGFSRQEYWVGCHTLFQGIFPTAEIKLRSLKSPALAGWFFTKATWKAYKYICTCIYITHTHIYMNIYECLLRLMLFNIFPYSILQTGYFTVEIGFFKLLHLFLQKPTF